MTDLPDISKHDPAQNIPLWAKERAREFQRQHNQGASLVVCSVASLAALLVEVDENACHQTIVEMSEINEGEWARCKRETLAEVRRVVESTVGIAHPQREILSRLDPLRVEDLLDGLPRLSTEAEALKAMGDGQPLVKMREIR